MLEKRCAQCEATMELEECQECLLHSSHAAEKTVLKPIRKLSTHCKRGHEFTDDNVKEVLKTGRAMATRTCRRCEKERQAKRERSQAGIQRKKR